MKFSSFQSLCDPIFACCFPFDFCSTLGCRRRQQFISNCQDKWSEELDVINLLKKVRDSHVMLKNLKSKENKALIKYSKDRIVGISDDSSSA